MASTPTSGPPRPRLAFGSTRGSRPVRAYCEAHAHIGPYTLGAATPTAFHPQPSYAPDPRDYCLLTGAGEAGLPVAVITAKLLYQSPVPCLIPENACAPPTPTGCSFRGPQLGIAIGGYIVQDGHLCVHQVVLEGEGSSGSGVRHALKEELVDLDGAGRAAQGSLAFLNCNLAEARRKAQEPDGLRECRRD